MVRKFIKEGPDKKGRTFIIQVDEYKETSTRNVVKFICEVQKQETEESTQMTADLLVENLNTDLAIKQSKLGEFEPKFENGTTVIVKNKFMAVVFSSSNSFTNKRSLIYRVIADANELTYRIVNNRNQDFEIETDKHLYNEDLDSLLYHTDQVCLIEVGEEDLRAY